jgi:hypothetical protein
MRVLVCGGREYRDGRFVYVALDVLHRRTPLTLLIHGDAGRVDKDTKRVVYGADKFAGQWARDRGVPESPHRVQPAEWAFYGKGAGNLRNQRMLDTDHPELVVAFPGGSGTADMTRRARAAGIPVLCPRPIRQNT